MTKLIRVDEKVHKQVKKIADENFRGIGEQVAYWVAMDCPHPVELREEKTATVVGSGETLRFFFCQQCKRHVCYIDQLSPSKKNAQSRFIALAA